MDKSEILSGVSQRFQSNADQDEKYHSPEGQEYKEVSNHAITPAETVKPAESSSRKHYIDSVHLIRGIAALLVVLEHVVGREPYARFNSIFGFMDGYGQGGVAAFFVISGMVLPLSLGTNYHWKKFPRFLLRRAVRIEATYLASILIASVIIALMSFLAPRGTFWLPGWKQIALHALYLIPFSNEEWIQPVYWTLAVEFQFYLLLGLLFPLIVIMARRSQVLAAAGCTAFALLVLLAAICPSVQLLKYSPCFALGMLVAGSRIFNFNRSLLVGCGVLIQGVAFWSGLTLQVIFASTLTAVVVVLWTGRIKRSSLGVKPFWFLGTISYSLYVTHQVLASAGENTARMLLRVMPGETGILLANIVPVGSLLASIVLAYLLWRLVERPTMLLSQRLRAEHSPLQ